jgi:hypothetical protein
MPGGNSATTAACYCQQLRACSTPPLPCQNCLQMAVKADYWDSTATLSACCAQLREALASPTFTAEALAQFASLLPEQVCHVPCACAASAAPSP